MTMVANRTVFDTLEPVTCYLCHVVFGLTSQTLADAKARGDLFYCPNGHSQHFTTSEVQRLRDEKARLQARLDQSQARAAELHDRIASKDRQISARKGVTTRLKRRLVNGRCPCCSRQFKDLERHMKVQHPKWDVDKHAAALEAKG